MGIRKLPKPWQPTAQDIRDYMARPYGQPTSPIARFIASLDPEKLGAVLDGGELDRPDDV